MQKKYKMFLIRNIIAIIFTISLIIFLQACEQNILRPEEKKLTRQELYDYMKEWYLWYDTIPHINPEAFLTLEDLLDTLTLKPLDRWSYIQETPEYNDYNSKGLYTGHGFGMRWSDDGRLMVSFVFDDSDLSAAGVERGWEITQINGNIPAPGTAIDTAILGPDEEGVENVFTFRTSSGSTQVITSTKKVIQINSILYDEVIDIANHHIAYFVLQNFVSTTRDELKKLFSELVDQNINDIIVDLRYNPGGIINVSQYLANLIAGNIANKGTFVKYVYNDKKTDRNTALRFNPESYSLNPSPQRVFFITTGSTASASEILINSLFPYDNKIQVYIVGEATHGKPVGMIAKQCTDYTLVPVTFYLYNADDQGEFFDGLPPNAMVADDLDEPFGSREEDCLKEVLYFIENESFSGSRKSYTHPYPWIQSGSGAIIGAI